ncbi:hypothetical protein [Methyloceanibacter caenitepidi]|uniref:YwqJ-like deaminase n=1 Tax=Methyloceanibacter caenitepidi TaxID=1384459 RepID=A0A0A8K6F0_9HYPH|nr:hypothetical protein [Methyloceanibacter caenitepidi]BAQ18117.1 hypothetical protein GL4_2683 [Methyloceanibacter caenitepidi]
MAEHGETPLDDNQWGTPERPCDPSHTAAIGTDAAWDRARLQRDVAFLQLKTAWGYAKLDQKLETFKQAFYVYYAEVFGEPYVPRSYVPKAFDPNQPRVPAGNPDGGQWTRIGGGSASSSNADEAPVGTRLAQTRRRNRATDAEGTLAQVTRRDVTEALARNAIQRVQRLDPGWRPSPSIERRNSIVGQIRRAEENLREAQARLRELEQQRAPEAIQTLRDSYGTDLLGRPLLGDSDTVAHGIVDGETFMGVNSGAIVEYSQRDLNDAKRALIPLVRKRPDIMSTHNIGQRPNDALFHAESTVLLRAARANDGTLSGKVIDITVDRPICSSCKKVLPLIGQELGNPIVRFTEPSGRVRTMHNGEWKDQD